MSHTARRILRRLLFLLTPILLTFAFAPFKQFWIAFVALIPLIADANASQYAWRTLLKGWLAGFVFFAINMHWMWTATIPGAIGVAVILGAFWGVFCLAAHLARPRSPITFSLLIPTLWTACEYLRGFTNFTWLLAGHSQSPFLPLAQIADITGVYGISFIVASVNAAAALWILRKNRSGLFVAVPIVALTLAYGFFRLHQTQTIPGPRILLVQPNFPYLRGGTRTVSREDSVRQHLSATIDALKSETPGLIVWSETVMPPLNSEARDELRRAPIGKFLLATDQQLSDLVSTHHTSLITGGYYVGGWHGQGRARVSTDIRNSAFFYTPDGRESISRYDKIGLVPFAESMPFRNSPQWLHKILLMLSAPSAAQPDSPGDDSAFTVFTLPSSFRFITPICFENVDGARIARMLRPPNGSEKRADFLVNLTNDGWFSSMQHAQHLQFILFRAIEDRVPIARCSNTGISAFIDSTGHIQSSLTPFIAGSLTGTMNLDPRTTFYTRHGNLFSWFCTALSIFSLFALRIRSSFVDFKSPTGGEV